MELSPRIGSLFTGTGALDMAARAIFGGRTVWHSDVKPAAVALLAHRLPDVPNLGDFTRLFPTSGPLPTAMLDLEPIDILTAGWPCQPHSSAGKRLGEDDPRALWPNVARAIGELRPAVFLGENVARIATNGELRRAVRSLAALGYVGTWRCVTAASVGAPHKRDRCFVLAVRADVAADPLGFELRDESGRSGGSGGPGAGVAGHDGAQGSPGLTLLPTPRASDGFKGGPGMRGSSGDLALSSAAVQMHGSWLDLPAAALRLLPTPTVNDSRGGRNATAGRSNPGSAHHAGWTLTDIVYDGSRWDRYAAAVERWEHVFGRSAPAPTMISLRTGGPQLAPPFVEWMMGLPAGWVSECPDLAPRPVSYRNARLSLLGDGVVPQQAEAAFRACLVGLLGAFPQPLVA